MRPSTRLLLLALLALIAGLAFRLCEAAAEATRLRTLVEGMREDLRNANRLRELDRIEGEVRALRRLSGVDDDSPREDERDEHP